MEFENNSIRNDNNIDSNIENIQKEDTTFLAR